MSSSHDRGAAARPRVGLGRLARLALKELRETLRDRRTVFTLVLMPLLVYPVLSLAFRQFLLSSFQHSAGRSRGHTSECLDGGHRARRS